MPKFISNRSHYHHMEAHVDEPVMPAEAIENAKRRKAVIKEYRDDGFYYGFAVGTGVSVVGLPVLAVLDATAKNNISYDTSKLINTLMLPITLPGMVLGAITFGIGGAIGAIVGHIKTRKMHD